MSILTVMSISILPFIALACAFDSGFESDRSTPSSPTGVFKNQVQQGSALIVVGAGGSACNYGGCSLDGAPGNHPTYSGEQLFMYGTASMYYGGGGDGYYGGSYASSNYSSGGSSYAAPYAYSATLLNASLGALDPPMIGEAAYDDNAGKIAASGGPGESGLVVIKFY
jgi:hypothetical protein